MLYFNFCRYFFTQSLNFITPSLLFLTLAHSLNPTSFSVVLKTLINAQYVYGLSTFIAVIIINGNDCLLCSMHSVRKFEFTCRFVHKLLMPAKIFFRCKIWHRCQWFPIRGVECYRASPKILLFCSQSNVFEVELASPSRASKQYVPSKNR